MLLSQLASAMKCMKRAKFVHFVLPFVGMVMAGKKRECFIELRYEKSQPHIFIVGLCCGGIVCPEYRAGDNHLSGRFLRYGRFFDAGTIA